MMSRLLVETEPLLPDARGPGPRRRGERARARRRPARRRSRTPRRSSSRRAPASAPSAWRRSGRAGRSSPTAACPRRRAGCTSSGACAPSTCARIPASIRCTWRWRRRRMRLPKGSRVILLRHRARRSRAVCLVGHQRPSRCDARPAPRTVVALDFERQAGGDDPARRRRRGDGGGRFVWIDLDVGDPDEGAAAADVAGAGRRGRRRSGAARRALDPVRPARGLRPPGRLGLPAADAADRLQSSSGSASPWASASC